MKATCPMQGRSVDIGFAGQNSKDNSCTHDYLGIHGKTCWILIKDHSSGYLIEKCQRSKNSPLNWIRDTLATFAPGIGVTENQYVHMDQGGEHYKNPKVRKIFEKCGFAVYPTGTDASHQNQMLAICVEILSTNDKCYAISWEIRITSIYRYRTTRKIYSSYYFWL